MYIPDKIWDSAISDCLKLIKAIEAVPEDIVYPYRKATLGILYYLVHMEDKPVPRKKRKKKVKLLT